MPFGILFGTTVTTVLHTVQNCGVEAYDYAVCVHLVFTAIFNAC